MADNTRTAPPRKASTAKASPAKASPRKAAPRKAAPAKAAPQRSAGAPTRAPATLHVSGRAAARKVEEAGHLKLRLPLVGAVRLPEPQQLGYFAAIGALGVLGVLEWPVALVLAGGHFLASNQHNRVVQQFGEALEDA
ncbi:MAG: hypothetical protein M3Y19_07280 [Actinomycetota bacterium]|nr:hypothetical protein [Actinomycetota bacterium]